MKTNIQNTWKEILKILKKDIGQIFATHIAYVALGIAVFTPLAGIVGQSLLGLSGQSVLSDLDIAYFFLTPFGMLAAILFATLLITILVFEQASMMAVCGATLLGMRITFMSTLYFTVRRTKKIFLFAIRLVIRLLFITLPFLAISIAIAWVMLTDYDINYYLAEKPPIFFIAAASIGLILLTMFKVLFKHLLSWTLALPLILFSDVSPGDSFTTSENLTEGHKHFLLLTFGSWALAATLLGTVLLGGIQLLGSILAPFFFDSTTLLVPALGGLVALWVFSNFLITTFTSGSFAALLMLCHGRSGSPIKIAAFTNNQQSQKKQMTVSLFIILLIAGVTAAVLVGGFLLKSLPADNTTMVIAHRGAAGKAPENTMVAMRHAINDGTDWLEIDVQETADGEVVVLHDSDFMKLAGVNLKIWDTTLQQAKEIDVGSWFNEEFSAERVPTLTEVLEEARGKCRVLIELKYYGHDQQLEQRVVDIVEQAGMVEDVAIMSLKYEGIKKFRTLRPDWPVGLLSSKAIGKISDLDVDFLAINMATAKPAFIRRIQSSGRQVYVWTVNDQASMSRMMALGVDGLITDEPALAREVFNKNKNMTSVERLLLHTAVLVNKPISKQTYRDQSP